jgi:hypothetical protein
LDWDTPAADPSEPAPPLGVVGGLLGGAPIPYPEQDQQKQAPRQREEAAPSAGEVSTLQFSAYHPTTVAVGVWQTLIVYTYLAEALAQIQADAATFTELGSAPTVAKGQASRQVEKGVELTVEPHMGVSRSRRSARASSGAATGGARSSASPARRTWPGASSTAGLTSTLGRWRLSRALT